MKDWLKIGAGLISGLAGGFLLAQRGAQPSRQQADRQRRVDYRQIEALSALREHLNLREPLPPMRGYAISPDFAVILLETLRDHKPRHTLELGCGVSTLIGAYTLEQYELEGRITSVEHQPAFAQITRDNLARHGLSAFVQVVDAPLVLLRGLHRWRGRWYHAPSIPADAIDLLVIDGPPQYQNPSPLARYPALPVLFGRLSPGALILVDDADRAHERRAIRRWLREYPLIEVRRFDTEKGTVLLRKTV